MLTSYLSFPLEFLLPSTLLLFFLQLKKPDCLLCVISNLYTGWAESHKMKEAVLGQGLLLAFSGRCCL